MGEHIIDLSEAAARLTVDLRCLRVDCEGRDAVRVPLDEVAAVVLANPRITCTRAALAGLAEAGAAVIACADNRLPVGLMLPLHGYHQLAQRFAAQAAAPQPMRKRLWRQIVSAKVRAQGRALESLRGQDMGLMGLSRRVRSGDPENIEAQAARRYWGALFPGMGFVRDPEEVDHNRLLNYGYAVLRALVGRAICGAGLHPGLGLHHHHRANPFCLADDLMEPFRPIVDRVVAAIVRSAGPDAVLDPCLKARLIEPLSSGTTYEFEEERRTLTDILGRVCASLASVFENGGGRLRLPEL